MKLLKYPNKSLATPSIPWDFSQKDSLVNLLFMSTDMMRVLSEAPNGVALAANQVGLPHRLFVIDNTYAERNNIRPLIVNPVILNSSVTIDESIEGCLSFPGVNTPVKRNKTVWVDFQDINGERFNKELNGFMARMFQHECEHLDGDIFLKNVDRKTRFRIIENIRKGR